MKSLALASILMILSGCEIFSGNNLETGIDWDEEDIVGYTFRSTKENDPTEYRFHENGNVSVIWGIEGSDDTIAPLMKWKKEERCLVIYDDYNPPLIYGIVELTGEKAVFRFRSVNHTFTKSAKTSNQFRFRCVDS